MIILTNLEIGKNILILIFELYHLYSILFIIFNFFILIKLYYFFIGDWGLGIGDWGFFIGDWGLGRIGGGQCPIAIAQGPTWSY